MLSALASLMLTSAPATAEERDNETEPRVECDAELLDDQDLDEEDGEGFGYLVEQGQPLTCRAIGLADEVEAGWFVGWEGMFGEGELDDVGTPVDGAFEFTVPLPDMPLWFDGVVFQGEEGTDDYIELFFWGMTDWEEESLDMTCEPEPVPMGETVTCVVDEAPPEEPFDWAVFLLDEEQERDLREGDAGDDFDDDFEEPADPIDPAITGEGTADADGIAFFEFEMPVDEAIVAYDAVAEFLVAQAWFEGSVVPAPDAPDQTPGEPEAPDPIPTAPDAPEPTPGEPEAPPSPVAVEQPTRVDTGAGGTAPATGGLAATGLLILVLATGAGAGLRRRLTRP